MGTKMINTGRRTPRWWWWEPVWRGEDWVCPMVGVGGSRSIKRRSVKGTKQPLVLTPSTSPPITLANGYAGPHRYTTDVSGLGTVPGIPHTSVYAWKYTLRCVLTSVLEKDEALESTLHPMPPCRNCRTDLATI